MPETAHDWRARLPTRGKWEPRVFRRLSEYLVVSICPSSGLLIYKDYSFEEVRKLKWFTATPRFAWLRDHTDYHYFRAQLMSLLGERPASIASTMMEATRQARSPAEATLYVSGALANYERVLQDPMLDYYDRMKTEMIAADLERRLGLFDRARARLSRVKPDSGPVERRLGFLGQLIDARNSSAPLMPQ